MKRITVVGANSNTAKFMKARLACMRSINTWQFMSHGDVETRADIIKASDVLINLAVHPQIMSHGLLNDETNMDSRLARLIQDRNTHYIMASSRMVYGDHPSNPEITEDTPLNPENAYGAAKVKIERQLSEILPASRLSVLRFTNIAGFNDFTQKGLVGTVFNRLAHGEPVKIDLDPDCLRDFLPQDQFSRVMIAFAENPQSGTFNLGSGVGLPLREVVNTWASVFDATVAYEPKQQQMGFWINSDRIHAATGVSRLTPETTLQSLRAEAQAARQAALRA